MNRSFSPVPEKPERLPESPDFDADSVPDEVTKPQHE
jgi:hypothetical protein